MESIKIYSSARCPYAQRTRMLMIEKEIPFELTEVEFLIKKNLNNSIKLITNFALEQISQKTNN